MILDKVVVMPGGVVCQTRPIQMGSGFVLPRVESALAGIDSAYEQVLRCRGIALVVRHVTAITNYAGGNPVLSWQGTYWHIVGNQLA